MCCLEASKSKILEYINLLEDLNIRHTVFYEPDIDDISSIAVEPLSRKLHKQLFKKFKLANNENRNSLSKKKV